MKDDVTKPRNCPFCGSAPYIKHFNPHDDEPSTAIGCDALGCPAKPSMNKGSYEDTLAAWNGPRPAEDGLAREPDAYLYEFPSLDPVVTFHRRQDFLGDNKAIESKLFRSPPLEPFERLVEELRQEAQKFEDADNTIQTQIADRIEWILKSARGTKT